VTRFLAAAALSGLAACGGALGPAPLDTAHDTCASCRMVVSDRRLAAQVVAPGEDPHFFDDLGCLREYLSTHRPSNAIVFVADHRTGDWTPASHAVFSRLPRPSTPMASGLVAHADPASRDADPSAAGSQPVVALDVLEAAALEKRP
jgi:copper chaperone NosL